MRDDRKVKFIAGLLTVLVVAAAFGLRSQQGNIFGFFFSPDDGALRIEAITIVKPVRVRDGVFGGVVREVEVHRDFRTFRAFKAHYLEEIKDAPESALQSLLDYNFSRIAYGQITFDSSTDANAGTSFTHTTSGTNRGLIVSTGMAGSEATVSGITYNSVAMAEEVYANSGNAQAKIFSLINPASGANTVAITGSVYSSGVVSFSGANQTDLVEATAATQGGSGNSVTTNITTLTANTYLVDAMADWGGTTVIGSPNGAQTLLHNTNAEDDHAGGSYKAVAAIGSASMNWAGGGGNPNLGHAVVAVAGVPVVASTDNSTQVIITISKLLDAIIPKAFAM